MDIHYKFEKLGCWYKDVCNKFGTEDCYAGCLRYMEMFHLMKNSGLPKNKQYPQILMPEDEDYSAFCQLRAIKNSIVDFVEEGRSLYLYSHNNGNGKTTWAIKLLQNYFNNVWYGNGFRVRGLFVHVPTFMNKLRLTINTKDKIFEHIRENLNTVDLVIWDDIASVGLKEYDYMNLLSYIDTRVLNGLSNIYTSNLDKDQLCQTLGDRLTSRIYGPSEKIELVGLDMRDKDI